MAAALVVTFVTGSLLSMSSYSYFGMWLGVELSSLAVYPWLAGNKSEAFCSSLFKYLVIQVVSSSIMYVGLVVLQGSLGLTIGSWLTVISLHLKFGSVFVGWLTSLVEAISWWEISLVLGAQNVPVLSVVLSLCSTLSSSVGVFSGVIMAVSSCVGCVMMSVRGFLVISSVLNIGWVWCSLVVSEGGGLEYFVLYVMGFIALCSTFMGRARQELCEVFGYSGGLSVFEACLIGGISGIPPFAVFFCKVETVYVMVSNGFLVECWVLMLMSVLLMYVYVGLIVSSGVHARMAGLEKSRESSIYSGSVIVIMTVFFLLWLM